MLEIPNSIKGDPSDGSEVEKIIDKFFNDTRKEIERRVGIQEGPPVFNIELYGMHHSYEQGFESTPRNVISDNHVRMLIYRTRNESDKLVASVISRRTEFNYVEWVFSSPVNQMTDDEL